MENWMPIKGYEGSYEVSDLGNVRSLDRYRDFGRSTKFMKGVIKALNEDKDGYYKVWLSENSAKKPFFVHRLVATAFIPNPNDLPVVNHKDGDKKNNVPENLEWCTISHNTKHAFDIKLRMPSCGGTSKPVAKIDPFTEDVIETYRSLSEAARSNGISVQMVSYAANGKSRMANGFKWAFVSEGVTTIESPSETA